MSLTPDELGDRIGPEVRELVEHVSKAKRAIKDIKEAYNTKEHEARLKKLLYEMVAPDDKGHHTVMVDGVKAKVFMRKGGVKVNMDAAKRLLHPNTFNAIFTQGNPSQVLEVDSARIPPSLDELFGNEAVEASEDGLIHEADDYYL